MPIAFLPTCLACLVLAALLSTQLGSQTFDDPPLIQRLRAACAKAPIVVAHRGASATHPENTLPAFARALEVGTQMIELDTRESADGTIYCLHDETLDRTTNATAREARVQETTDAVLATLDAGAWKGDEHAGARVPTLAEALDLIQPKAVTMIEHKAGTPARMAKLLREKDLLDDVLVQSFDWEWLEELHRLEPTLPIGALGHEPLTEGMIERLERTGARLVHWDASRLRAEDVARLHERGHLVCVYTIDSDIALVGAAALGVDLITTNTPRRLVELKREGVARRR